MGQQQPIAIERILQKREADPASTGRHGIAFDRAYASATARRAPIANATS
jgi:hypothetical protein